MHRRQKKRDVRKGVALHPQLDGLEPAYSVEKLRAGSVFGVSGGRE